MPPWTFLFCVQMWEISVVYVQGIYFRVMACALLCLGICHQKWQLWPFAATCSMSSRQLSTCWSHWALCVSCPASVWVSSSCCLDLPLPGEQSAWGAGASRCPWLLALTLWSKLSVLVVWVCCLKEIFTYLNTHARLYYALTFAFSLSVVSSESKIWNFNMLQLISFFSVFNALCALRSLLGQVCEDTVLCCRVRAALFYLLSEVDFVCGGGRWAPNFFFFARGYLVDPALILEDHLFPSVSQCYLLHLIRWLWTSGLFLDSAPLTFLLYLHKYHPVNYCRFTWSWELVI